MNTLPLRIQIHDWSGHTFQAQLSRALAQRGMQVEHCFSSEYLSGKGRLELESGDPDGLLFTRIKAQYPFDKYDPLGRLRYELSYARAWISRTRLTRPDVVMVCNTPLFTLHRFSQWAHRTSTPWILWHQDILSLALAEELRRKLRGPIVRAGAWSLSRTERRITRMATQVVPIGQEFRRHYEQEWKLMRSGVSVIPNWAPLEEITPCPLNNSWSADWITERGDITLIYAGTLGRKHNPELLVDLVRATRARRVDARLIVVSEGEGAELIRTRLDGLPAGTIRVIPFQPAHKLREMLGAGDILITILEPEASRFSIPSKVLSYLAAGRPLLGLMPAENPAANDIRAAGGLVAPPSSEGVGCAADWLASIGMDTTARLQLGMRSRRLAEERFNIDRISDQFVEIISAAAKKGLVTSRRRRNEA